jgi:hypothetical protein
MQFAPENDPLAPVEPRRPARIKRRILDGMDPATDVMAGGVDRFGPTGPMNGNTGIGGGMPRDIAPPPPPVDPPRADFSAGGLLPVLRKYEHTPEGLQKAFAENPHWGAAGAKIQGGDIYNPETKRWLDVIRGASRGGEDWQYLDEQEGGADYDPNKGMSAGGFGSMRGMDSTQTSLIDQVRQMILQLMGTGQ